MSLILLVATLILIGVWLEQFKACIPLHGNLRITLSEARVNPADFVGFMRAVKQPGIFWAALNGSPPSPGQKQPEFKAAQ